jgi:RNA polymerase sigma factor FliA
MEKEQELKLWQKVSEGKDAVARLTLIDHYAYLARINAAHYYRTRTADDIEFGDYLQFAMLGLIEAVQRYAPVKGASFATYAGYRIKGALLNGLEKFTEHREQSSFLRRYQRSRIESIADGLADDSTDRFAEMVEVTIELALSFMLEDAGFLLNDNETEDKLFVGEEQKALSIHLGELIDHLPERERLVIRNHYFHGMAFDEMARYLGISKSRVSQLHTRALQLIKVGYENAEGLDNQY